MVSFMVTVMNVEYHSNGMFLVPLDLYQTVRQSLSVLFINFIKWDVYIKANNFKYGH